jgi:hypothetical protein
MSRSVIDGERCRLRDVADFLIDIERDEPVELTRGVAFRMTPVLRDSTLFTRGACEVMTLCADCTTIGTRAPTCSPAVLQAGDSLQRLVPASLRSRHCPAPRPSRGGYEDDRSR